MVQRGKNLRLPLEPRDSLVILRERRGKNLDRDIAIEPGIPRAKHLAHPSRTDGRDDFVGANPAAGLYRQGRGLP